LAANPWSEWQRFPKNEGFFPIGVWAQNPSDASAYQELGINFYYALHGGPTNPQVELLRKYRMSFVCSLNSYARQDLLDEPLAWGWMHPDEPDLAQHYPRTLLMGSQGKDIIREKWPELYQSLNLDEKEYQGWGLGLHPVYDIQAQYREMKKADPSRPVFLQLSKAVATDGKFVGRGDRDGKAEDYPQYILGSDVVSYDIYPVANGQAKELALVGDGLDNLKKWGSGTRPLLMILEAGYGQTWATPAQQRAMAWIAVNHGAQGIVWFVHRWEGEGAERKLYSTKMPLKYPEIGASLKRINTELQQLAPVIYQPPVAGGVTITGMPLDMGVRKRDEILYLFAVESQGQAGSTVFEVPVIQEGSVEVINEDRTLKIEKGQFSDDFQPWDVHLYKINLPGKS
jgi:hypothetical protein